MAPPTAPRLAPLKVVFVDIPANIAIDDILCPDSTSFHDFMACLCKLSGSVIDQLKDLAQLRVRGQGFTLDDGCWWYRIVSQEKSRNGDNTSPVKIRKRTWKVLDSSFGYDALLAEMSLGVTTDGGWIEVQHVSKSLPSCKSC